MKSFLFIFLFAISSLGFSQNNHIVKTEDGRRVLLKADFTWEYIDLETPTDNKIDIESTKLEGNDICNLPDGFVEPKLNKKIQIQLKKGRATISHVKKKVAKDYNCIINQVVLISVREQKEKAVYDFCVNGTKVSYKRVGNSIIKAGRFF